MAEWSRVLHTTLKDFIKKREVNVLRNRKLTALLQSKGRVTFNNSGNSMEWRVEYKQVSLGDGYADMDSLTFARRDRFLLAELPWRGYAMTDAVSLKEKLMNKGKEAIIRVLSETAELLLSNAEELFGEELYVDGNATGNERRIHGIESFLGTSGANAGGFIGTPDDNFAGLDTDLAAYGGTWTGNWPAGTGTSDYDFWSPIIVDYTDTAWAAATKTWPNTCLEALRYGIIKSQRSKAKTGMLTVIVLTDDLYKEFLDKLATSERIVVERGQKQSPLIALGYNDVVSYDGVDVTWEYGVPATVGYGFNCDMMELRSLQNGLFEPITPVFDENTLADRFALTMFANCKWNPRHFVKWDNIT